ncbi:MAG: restriction endonuclease S subunit [Algoriphagus marincola HL-49]|uniref:Restriction endonuclease S subunit n=1 Tax=Algoriphagus marincola HL-49 TaxID=1305737 RepID=A0A0P7YE96_9BACT|nr:MAG: restriction endonuclease S subunit [Algoriphagus marincola HL-49]
MLFSIKSIFVEIILKNKLKKKLKEIASIRSGVFLKPRASGQILYLQAKDFDEDGVLSNEVFPTLESFEVSEKHLLKKGEVLFSAKGYKNFAAVYDNSEFPAVASTSFLVISLSVDYIEPRFLAWWLNSPVVQEFLKGIAKGTSIPSITKTQLQELEVTIFPQDVQDALVRLAELRKKEKMILADIERLNDYKLDLSLIKIIQRYE